MNKIHRDFHYFGLAGIMPIMRHINSYKRIICLAVLFFSMNGNATFVNPDHYPNIRSGTLPVRDVFLFIKNSYVKKNVYGEHTYWMRYYEGNRRKDEKNGILYTCRGGFLDVAHVRNAIDWVGYIAANVYPYLLKDIETYTHRGEEPTLYTLNFQYPDEYRQLSYEQKARVAKKLSIVVAQQIAYHSLVWHEIVSWSGYIHALYTEKPSGFSFEDNYSNLLGIIIGGLAAESRYPFNEAADYHLKYYINMLEPIEKSEAIEVTESLSNKWWNPKYLLVNNKKIIKRHLDYGQFDEFVRPWQVSGVRACNQRPSEMVELMIPKLDFIEGIDFGQFMEVVMKSNLGWQDKKISYYFKDDPETINNLIPTQHFPSIVEIIRHDLKIIMDDPFADQSGIYFR